MTPQQAARAPDGALAEDANAHLPIQRRTVLQVLFVGTKQGRHDGTGAHTADVVEHVAHAAASQLLKLPK